MSLPLFPLPPKDLLTTSTPEPLARRHLLRINRTTRKIARLSKRFQSDEEGEDVFERGFTEEGEDLYNSEDEVDELAGDDSGP